MKSSNTKSILFAFALFGLLLSTLTYAQNGKLSGFVTDSETGEPLIAANVVVQGTSLGAATDMQGNYSIPNIPPGDYIIKCGYIGYDMKTSIITIKPNRTLVLDFALSFGIIEGETVIVTAQSEGQLAAINQQIRSNSIVNVVSKARIEELPDVNAAEAVGRLPGTSIVRDGGEGTKVVIRGLEPKLNNVKINGVEIPATELEERGVDLSMITPNVLDGIELSKAPTPDKDANAIGGSINFILKQAPKGFKSNFLIQKGYNSEENSFMPIKLNGFVSDRLFDESLGIIFQASYDYSDRSSDVLGASYKLLREKEGNEDTAPNYVDALELYDRNETRQKYSTNLLMDYSIPNGNIVFSTIYSGQLRDQIVRGNKYNGPVRDTPYFENSMKEMDSEIDVLMSSFNFDYNFWGITSENIFSYSRTRNLTPKNYYLTFREYSMYSPDINEAVKEYGPSVIQNYTSYNAKSGIMDYMSSGSSDGVESNFMIDLNFEYPINITNNISSEFKFGGKFVSKSRKNDYVKRGSSMYFNTSAKRKFHDLFPEIEPNSANTIKFPEFADTDYSEDQFLDDSYYIPYSINNSLFNDVISALELDLVPSIGIRKSNFEMVEELTAAYLMTTLQFGQKLTLLGGVRYEHNIIDMTAYGTDVYIDPTSGLEVGTYWPIYDTNLSDLFFPALHLKYNATEWFTVRLAKTKSLSRPSFGFMRPTTWIDNSNLRVFRGNPDLKPSVSSNYDIVFSFYKSNLGLFAVSGFYKKIDDMYFRFIHTVLDDGRYGYENLGLTSAENGFTLYDYINSKEPTYVKGFELDFQPNLNFLPGMLRGLVINLNYTKLFSDTKYPYTTVESVFNPNPPPFITLVVTDTTRKGRMLRQSNDILNLAVGYDYRGFSCRMSLLFQGNTLSKVGSRAEEDGFTQDLLRLDFSAKQSFPWGIELFFNANNLTNRPDQSIEPVNSFNTASEYYGATADLGIKYKFN